MAGPSKLNLYQAPYHWTLAPFWAEKHQRPIKFAKDHLFSGGIVLDVGCGDGKLTALLSEKVRKVYGTDHQLLPLRMARLLIQAENVELIQHDATTEFPFNSSLFDIVTAFDVVEHLPLEKLSLFLQEVRRVLKDTGKFILTTPNRSSLRRRIWRGSVNPKHYYEFSLEEIRGALQSHLFGITEVRGIYLPLPIPRAEHYANVFPFSQLFRFLIRVADKNPEVSETLYVVASKKINL